MTEQHRSSTDDEALSALLDGELGQHEAERLRERIAHEPALAARLEQLQRSDARVRDVYAGVLDEPLPQSVVELLQPAGAVGPGRDVETASDSAKVVELRPRDPRRWLRLPAAIAAGIGLVVGVLVGNVTGPGDSTPQSGNLVARAGIVESGTMLHDVLQSAPSADTRELGPDVEATPRLTFRSRNGDYCRQVELASAQGTTETLACRRDGRWQLEVASFAARPPGTEGVYRPAAGDGTPVRDAVDSMIDGAPLDADAERALIASDWAPGR